MNKADGVEDRVKSRAGREMVPAFTQEGIPKTAEALL